MLPEIIKHQDSYTLEPVSAERSGLQPGVDSSSEVSLTHPHKTNVLNMYIFWVRLKFYSLQMDGTWTKNTLKADKNNPLVTQNLSQNIRL